jgi:8-oxo-dGTP pyrophosphatase MutT (NUDIX family)
MTDWPDDLPILRRRAVRVVVLDAHRSVLLFHTHDAAHPDLGEWWELPGGGLDEGETYLEAAVREIREEAGFVADPGAIGVPSWRRADFEFRWWTVDEIELGRDRFYPGRLPSLLAPFLAGEQIDEPFELFS